MKRSSRNNGRGNTPFLVRFWGVRGSYPTTDSKTQEIGGNTSCVEVTVDKQRLIFDAGTGIIPLGKKICDEDAPHPTAYVFLSHTHIDHVVGLCFFEPLLTAEARSFIYGPGNSQGALTRSLRQLTHSHLFPVTIDELKGRKEIHSLQGGEIIRFTTPGKKPRIDKHQSANRRHPGELNIAALKIAAHPRFGVMLYRVNFGGKSLVYATDIEQREGGYPEIIEFARGADLLIHDAQYLQQEYYSESKSKRGWGHSTIEMAAEVARRADVKRLALFHHEPTHDDKAMRRIGHQVKRLFPASVVARDGMETSL
ncbi:MAG: MBL fold metallo-hydrolase [Deltaproteobacteria bacterium]|nr:MBL fold metallo-hydrolase [Deltaproteobacteria bacterium]